MPEYQLRRDKNGVYYQEPIYSTEELEEIEAKRVAKETEEKVAEIERQAVALKEAQRQARIAQLQEAQKAKR